MVVIASDHAGYDLKRSLISFIKPNYEVLDLGTDDKNSVDYPDIANRLTDIVSVSNAPGILICGTGIGISVAANRAAGIRAAVCTCPTMARLARLHNDANVLCLGARIVGEEAAQDIVSAFLTTSFDGGERHQRRIEKLG